MRAQLSTLMSQVGSNLRFSQLHPLRPIHTDQSQGSKLSLFLWNHRLRTDRQNDRVNCRDGSSCNQTWVTRLAHQRTNHWATKSQAISWPGNSRVASDQNTDPYGTGSNPLKIPASRITHKDFSLSIFGSKKIISLSTLKVSLILCWMYFKFITS